MRSSVPVRSLLVVDDEPKILNSIKRELKQEGYRIHTARNGMEGLEVVRNHNIGVILSDLMMPEMDGIAFLEQARRLKPDIVRIILTGHGTFENASMAINRSNVFGFLTKPWQSESLITLLLTAFEHFELVMDHRRLQRMTEEQNEQLRNSRDMLQSVFDSIPEPLIMLDEYLQALMLNGAALGSFHEAQASNAIGVSVSDYFKNRYGRSIADAIEMSVKKSCHSKHQAEVAQGDFRLEEISIHPIHEGRKAGNAAVARIRDMTDEIRMERKRHQQEKLESLGMLITGLFHEINNPNNLIFFNTPILRDYLELLLPIVDDYAERIPEYEVSGMSYDEFRKDLIRLLDNIEGGAKRIDGAVRRLRDFSGRGGVAKRCLISPSEIIKKAVFLCHDRMKKTVRNVEVEIEETIPPFYSDPEALEQILIALLINAADAADKEDPYVRITVVGRQDWRERLVIEIADNGYGMDKKTQERIFEPFFTTKQYGSGIGMGLFVCRNLIADLGGSIKVESTPEVGTLFRVILPDIKILRTGD